jgi:hypothetical protein
MRAQSACSATIAPRSGSAAFERLATDSDDDRSTILDVLNAHARAIGSGDARKRRVQPDVEGAVIAISRLRRPDDRYFPVLNDTSLAHARLRELHLANSRLRGANLHEALLDRADLTQARL